MLPWECLCCVSMKAMRLESLGQSSAESVAALGSQLSALAPAPQLCFSLGASMCLDCVRLSSLWATFFHGFGKFSATAFPNMLSLSFFISSRLLAVCTSSHLSFLVFSVSVYREKCLLGFVFHFMNLLTFNFLNVSIAYFFQLQWLFFTFRSPSSIMLPILVSQSYFWVLFLPEHSESLWHVQQHLYSDFLLGSCWWLLQLSSVLCSSFWNIVGKFKVHSTERCLPEPLLSSQLPSRPLVRSGFLSPFSLGTEMGSSLFFHHH